MSLYPLRMDFPCSTGGKIHISVTRGGWEFDPDSRPLFDALNVSERLNLRRQFEAQVLLAKATPTKGDT